MASRLRRPLPLMGLFTWALLYTSAAADPIAVGDVVRITTTGLPAGVARASGFIGGPFVLTNLSQGDAGWVTFCVELDERVTFGATYLVTGIGTLSRETNRPLDRRTAWLYEQFRRGTLASHDLAPWFGSTRYFDPASGTDTRSLQFAIWLAQGYVFTDPPSFINLNPPLPDELAHGLLGLAGAMAPEGYIGSVRIVNLVTNDAQRLAKQDQLTLVPEPGVGLLLLSGLFAALLACRHRR